ncbi:MAG: metallophosphoesterase [Microcystis sp. M38BS1]|uniref:metallophosphoesterase n=1 Tax=Microcystis sp. M38BS1 TaxID=2771188 RepID=UPI0031FC8101|nr:metallophosphoesterase [Microcystis sp. M38BS1]MCA6582486.1 metallophosphoesterase [Pseudanabaena sp. M34BS1SP1A06MG]
MKILPLSDLHLEFSALHIPNTDKADITLLLGDIHTGIKGVQWAANTIESKHIIYILGNHECYGGKYPDTLNKIRAEAEKYSPNFHVLENESVVINDVTFFGCTLWTDFALFGDAAIGKLLCYDKMNDYKQIRLGNANHYRKIRPSDTEYWHHESVDAIRTGLYNEEPNSKRVICTHHAPSPKSLNPQFFFDPISAAYASNLDGFVAYSGAKYWFHGHLHESVNYELGDTQVISNPRGYNDSNEQFDTTTLWEI